jgi:hypothetical protein
MKKQKMTIDDHRQIAAHLYAVEEHLAAISDALSGKAPASIQDMFLDASPLLERLGAVKFAMEDFLVKEHPNLGASETSMYFGSVDVECATRIEPNEDPRAQKLWSLSGFTLPRLQGDAR